MLTTKFIYVDTNQWRAISFDWSNQLAQAIVEGTRSHRMTLLMTEILDREISALIDRDVEEYVQSLTKAEAKRAFSWGQVHSALYGIDLGDMKRRLHDQLQQQKARYFSQCSPLWLHHTGETLGAVLKTYFGSRLPFENKAGKKSEFPDAIALQMLMEWSRDNGASIYVVSQDQGVRNACLETKCLLPLDTLSDLIREMNVGTEDDFAVKRILNEHRSGLAEAISERLIDMPSYLADEHEDSASIQRAEVEVLDADLLLRPAPDNYRAIVRTSARIYVAAYGDDYRYWVAEPGGQRSYSQKREILFAADLDVNFMVDLRIASEQINFEWVEPIGAQSIEVAANWAEGEPLGPIRAYLADPPSQHIPF